MKRRNCEGFTLIELLIVVAIIAILAAIAVPNFMEAQVRAKVSRVISDHRTLATALESYHIDHNNYPDPYDYSGESYVQYIPVLSTPVSYVSSLEQFIDPFKPRESIFVGDDDWKGTYWYATINGTWGAWGPYPNWRPKIWCVHSYGPDRVQGVAYSYNGQWMEGLMRFPYYWVYDPTPENKATAMNMLYDATNGTKSPGDVGRFGGETAGIPSVLGGGGG